MINDVAIIEWMGSHLWWRFLSWRTMTWTMSWAAICRVFYLSWAVQRQKRWQVRLDSGNDVCCGELKVGDHWRLLPIRWALFVSVVSCWHDKIYCNMGIKDTFSGLMIKCAIKLHWKWSKHEERSCIFELIDNWSWDLNLLPSVNKII